MGKPSGAPRGLVKKKEFGKYGICYYGSILEIRDKIRMDEINEDWEREIIFSFRKSNGIAAIVGNHLRNLKRRLKR